jgi:hypothetical protein
MATSAITILPENRIIIRTPSVWHMVTIGYCKEQQKFSKNPIFEKAYREAKEEYGDKYEQ